MISDDREALQQIADTLADGRRGLNGSGIIDADDLAHLINKADYVAMLLDDLIGGCYWPDREKETAPCGNCENEFIKGCHMCGGSGRVIL